MLITELKAQLAVTTDINVFYLMTALKRGLLQIISAQDTGPFCFSCILNTCL